MPGRTKIFLDTEFTGLTQKTTLISLAMVSETGEEFYAEFTDYDRGQVNPWIQEHVLDHLILDKDATSVGALVLQGSRENDVAYALRLWLTKFDAVEVWSDTLAYDWVLFCQLFGGALNIPKNIYYIPFDLATLFKVLGIDPDVSREEFANLKDGMPQHNALHDARVQRRCYEICMELVNNGTKTALLP